MSHWGIPNSNTTLVKVKLIEYVIHLFKEQIQIQHLLKLNLPNGLIYQWGN